VKNFTLSVYAFHLCQTLDDSPDAVTPGADGLWESLSKLGENSALSFPELKNLKSTLICYRPAEDKSYQYAPQPELELAQEWLTYSQFPLPFSPISTQAGFKLTGNLQPFRLHDTYCADLTLYPEEAEAEINVEHLNCFSFQSLETITADLGKIFWITGELNAPDDECHQQIEKYVNALFPGKIAPNLIEQGTLFKSLFYIYEIAPQSSPDSTQTIFISINNHQANSAELAEKAYYWLRDFLWSRQKILYAYQQARTCYKNARTLYSTLEANLKHSYPILQHPQNRLTECDRLLSELPTQLLNYSCALRDLQAHYTTLKTNYQNLTLCLKKVLQPGDQVDTWQDFQQRLCPRYLRQIKTYLDYLIPGQVLFTDLTNTIRATAAVEQAKFESQRQEAERKQQESKEKADKELQDHIQSIGVGIAAGAIVASTSGLITQPWKMPWSNERSLLPHPFIIAFVLSVFCSWGAWRLAKRWIQARRSK
jgi:hypothetical protein